MGANVSMSILGEVMLDRQKRCKKRQDAELMDERRIISIGTNCRNNLVSRNRRLFICIYHDVERIRVSVKRHLSFEARGGKRVP